MSQSDSNPADGGASDSGREQLVTEAFVALADTLVDDYDMLDLLDRLVGYSVALLAADAAGILLGDTDRDLRVVASSSDDAELMELMALQAEEGPCIECVRTATAVSVPDLSRATDRWPIFTAAVADRGAFASAHALPLRLRGRAIGALTLLHPTPGPLPVIDLALGQALADVATIGILQERAIRRGEIVNEQLQTALNSRVIIEQAKGVLAQRAGLDMDAAFDRLRRFARGNNLRLVDLARQVVAGEVELDGRSSPPPERRPAVPGSGRDQPDHRALDRGARGVVGEIG